MVGEGLRIPYDRKLIKDAPDFGVGRHLSPEQELQLYHHYRLDISSPASDPVSSPGSGDKDFGRIAGSDD